MKWKFWKKNDVDSSSEDFTFNNMVNSIKELSNEINAYVTAIKAMDKQYRDTIEYYDCLLAACCEQTKDKEIFISKQLTEELKVNLYENFTYDFDDYGNLKIQLKSSSQKENLTDVDLDKELYEEIINEENS